MDVDKMFKLPALPSGAGNKRKFPDAPAPGQFSCKDAVHRKLIPRTAQAVQGS